MGQQYLIDTNIVSDFFSAALPEVGLQFMEAVIDAVPKLSVITQIELLCWKSVPDVEQKLMEFINDSIVLNITPKVIEYCVNLRKMKKIKIPDAIIAATALAHNCILITNNEKDFANVEGLSITNPHKIRTPKNL
jgi:predicted nucleic acid-binding protein